MKLRKEIYQENFTEQGRIKSRSCLHKSAGSSGFSLQFGVKNPFCIRKPEKK